MKLRDDTGNGEDGAHNPVLIHNNQPPRGGHGSSMMFLFVCVFCVGGGIVFHVRDLFCVFLLEMGDQNRDQNHMGGTQVGTGGTQKGLSSIIMGVFCVIINPETQLCVLCFAGTQRKI